MKTFNNIQFVSDDEIEKNTSAVELARSINGMLWLAIEANTTTGLVTEPLIHARKVLSGINHEHCAASQKQKMLNEDNIAKVIALMKLLTFTLPAYPSKNIVHPVLKEIAALLGTVHFSEASEASEEMEMI